MIITRLKRATEKLVKRFGYEIVKSTSIDPFEAQKKLIQTKEPVIFDIGAHWGSVSKIYNCHFPKGSIHSFEPFPESFKKLTELTKNDPCICCHQKAVSDCVDKAILNANQSSGTNSLLKSDDRGASYWGQGLLDTVSQITVETTTVDAFCSEENIPHIDILKIDVQGFEYSVLQGARRMLNDQKISLIYTEIIMCPTYKGQHKFHEYLSFLADSGYEFVNFFNPIKRHNQLIQADVIFLNSSLTDELLPPSSQTTQY